MAWFKPADDATNTDTILHSSKIFAAFILAVKGVMHLKLIPIFGGILSQARFKSLHCFFFGVSPSRVDTASRNEDR